MVLLENIRLALEGLRTNKLRALLTMLGIIIGIGSVIGIVTVGDALSIVVAKNLQSLGSTNVMIAPIERDASGGAQLQFGGVPDDSLITDDMLERFAVKFAERVEAVAVSMPGGAGHAQEGSLSANVSEIGVNAGYRPAYGVEMLEGRFVRDEDVTQRRLVAVVSDRFVASLYPKTASVLGLEFKVSTRGTFHTFTIIGVYKYQQSLLTGSFLATGSGQNVRTDVYIPVSTCILINSLAQGYLNAVLMASSDTDMHQFETEVTDFFNTFFTSNPRYHIETVRMDQLMSTVNTVLSSISVAVAVIGGISLIVGGIGVMNIMLVSVTERTREIGTRKAMGARNSAIRIQFIVEAVIICSFGGMLGVVVGFFLGALGSTQVGFPVAPTIEIIVVAVLFSMLIGVFFGYYPAHKASKLKPIEALNSE